MIRTMLKVLIAAIALLVCAVASPSTSEAAGYTFVIKMEGVDGESRLVPGGIDVTTFNFGVTVPSVMYRNGSGGGGAVAGKPDFAPLAFAHGYDKSAPKLFVMAASAEHINHVELKVFRTSGGKNEEILAIKLDEVFVSSIQIHGAAESLPVQTVSLVYGKITFEYTNGGVKQNGGWNVKGNSKA